MVNKESLVEPRTVNWRLVLIFVPVLVCAVAWLFVLTILDLAKSLDGIINSALSATVDWAHRDRSLSTPSMKE